jgi:polyisoprenoid-binding protein YceI
MLLGSIGTAVIVVALIGLLLLRQFVFGATPQVHHPQQGSATACTGVTMSPGLLAFRLDSQQSTASYQAHFQAAGQSLPGTVNGVTGFVSGDFILHPGSPLTVQSLKVVVDLRTLDSGAPERDDHVRNDTFETARFPLATFTVTTPEVLQGQFSAGQTAGFKLPGQLTLHGVTRTVTFDMHAQMQGQVMTGTGTTQIDLRDYQMKPPQTTSVVPITISDRILLQIQLRAIEVVCLLPS